MSLRVISGKAKGRKLKPVPGNTTRPITDRVKEALFNILAGDIQDAVWWDLFGGTGAVGIEALSRGAAFVRFLDLSKTAVAIIRDNLEHTQLAEQAEVKRADAFSYLDQNPDRQFDYIYIAPPQYNELWSEALSKIDRQPGWLVQDGWVIVQIHPREYRNLILKNVVKIDERKYGSTLLVFYERKSSTETIDSGEK
ncbi:MAG: 16S rRNA (guanine(966)-N(2))-methyltransferase RsmD [Anaerolineales bacterium]|nr:16S rRNA (guanine(966)-N(2))-methyltransferase RsmD [Anaerolineales bacterium]